MTEYDQSFKDKDATPADILMLHDAIKQCLENDDEPTSYKDESSQQFYFREMTELIPMGGLRRLAVRYNPNHATIEREIDDDEGSGYVSEAYRISTDSDKIPEISQSTWYETNPEESTSLDDLMDTLNFEEEMGMDRVTVGACHALTAAILKSRVHPIQPDPNL